MTGFKHFQLRTREGFLKYVKIELLLLRKEWKILLPCVLMQCTSRALFNVILVTVMCAAVVLMKPLLWMCV